MSANNPDSRGDLKREKETGPHIQSETHVRGQPVQPDPEDDRTPADRAESAQTPETATNTAREYTETETPRHHIERLTAGDNTLLDRIEVDISNPSDSEITDTLTADLHTLVPAGRGYSDPGPQPMWPSSIERTVTLPPNGRTTLAVSGDGSLSIPGFVDPIEQPLTGGPGSGLGSPVTLQTGFDTRLTIHSNPEGDTPLTVDRSKLVCLPTRYREVWRSNGTIEDRGPMGRPRMVMYPAQPGRVFPEGITTDHTRQTIQTNEPTSPRIGSHYYFRAGAGPDGQDSDFDPGNGEGEYLYKSTGWVFVA